MEDKNIVTSKKANMGVIGVGAIVGVGFIAVASGVVTGPVALPIVVDAIKWLIAAYLGAQGAQDVATAVKGKPAQTDSAQSATVDKK